MIGRRPLIALVALVALIAGCSLATDASPRDISADQLPPRLQATESTSTTAPPAQIDTVSLTVYLLDSENPLLQQRSRDAADTTVATMLAELRRVTDEDIQLGLRTLIDDEYRLVGAIDIDNAALVLPLSAEFYNLEGQNRALAAAQIVFTATALPDIDSVLFVNVEGVPQGIPNSDLVVAEEPRPMVREDFAPFDPLDSDN